MQVEDPWTSETLKYTEMGFSREEVCMALAALGTDADKDNEVRAENSFLELESTFACCWEHHKPNPGGLIRFGGQSA